ncbi:MAG: hypothetical protein VKK42_20970 [Lyngbya sp.]|nr:hypothetical protein [Lyngbya sp.]
MPRNRQLRDRVQKLGLNVVNVMWEDTARTPGSVWGALLIYSLKANMSSTIRVTGASGNIGRDVLLSAKEY